MNRNSLSLTRRAIAALIAGAAMAARARDDKPLRLVVNIGLQSLDPIAGASYRTRNLAYMVFDTLAAMDSTEPAARGYCNSAIQGPAAIAGASPCIAPIAGPA